MKEKHNTDNDLIKAFKKGSVSAFEELVHRYEAKIHSLAFRLTRNAEDTEEVLQDVFTTVYKKVAGFEGKSMFSSWLYRVTVNASFMKLRKRKQHSLLYLEDLSDTSKQHYLDSDPLFVQRSDSITYGHELQSVLASAIERLPFQYRAVFILRDVDGMSNQEVAEVLDLTIPAVKSRLHRSRLMLRKRLSRYYHEFTNKKNNVKHTIDLDLDNDAADFCSEGQI